MNPVAACRALEWIEVVDRWNGTAWTIQSTSGLLGDESRFSGVSCWSATACEAGRGVSNSGAAGALGKLVGGTLAHPFQLAAYPGDSEFLAVSCTSKAACTAVEAPDDLTSSIIEQWDGVK